MLSKQRSPDNDGAVQYFDNGDQFLSTEEQQRKLTQGNYNTQIMNNQSSSNFLNLKKKNNTFMSNITELSPNNTGSKSTTNKKMSQHNNKEPSKSSYVTTINRKDSVSNISKQ